MFAQHTTDVGLTHTKLDRYREKLVRGTRGFLHKQASRLYDKDKTLIITNPKKNVGLPLKQKKCLIGEVLFPFFAVIVDRIVQFFIQYVVRSEYA